MSIFNLKFKLLISVLVAITNMIPYFGPFIGAIPCLIIVTITDPLHGLYLLIFVLVLQQVDGNIISPKIIGDKTGLSGFWVLFAILLFGGTFGFLGMLAGVPVFAVIYHEIRRILHRFLEKKKLRTETEFYQELLSIEEDGSPVYRKENQDKPPHKNIFKKKEEEKDS